MYHLSIAVMESKARCIYGEKVMMLQRSITNKAPQDQGSMFVIAARQLQEHIKHTSCQRKYRDISDITNV
jgi:hypothetical protein